MSPKKILFSLTYFSPYISGLTLYVRNLASQLAEKDFQITVLTMQYDNRLPEIEVLERAKIIRAKTDLRLSKGFISFDFIRHSLKLVRQNEIVVISLPQAEGAILAILARLFRKKLLVIYHCDVVLPEIGLNWLIQSLLDLSNFLTLSLAGTVINSSSDFARHSRLLKKFLKKTQFVYPPIIKPEVIEREKKLLRKKIGKFNILIGFIGRMAADKGLEFIFEAIPILEKKLKKYFKIVIAGPAEPIGEVDYRYKIQKLARQNKNNLIFLGQLKDSQLGALYSLLDVLVLPSVNSTEAFGMVQVEAMLMGVPIVVSDLPGVRIPVRETGMGKIVPPRDPDALAKAITEVLHNRKDYLRGKEKAENIFKMEKTVDFYHKLII